MSPDSHWVFYHVGLGSHSLFDIITSAPLCSIENHPPSTKREGDPGQISEYPDLPQTPRIKKCMKGIKKKTAAGVCSKNWSSTLTQ